MFERCRDAPTGRGGTGLSAGHQAGRALWILTLTAALVSGCGADSRSNSVADGRAAAATNASGSQQELDIYNWADYIGHNTIAEFERATGIKVVYGLYDSNETLEAKLLAGHTGYDLVSTTTGFYARQIRAGAYMPLDRRKLSNWGNLDAQVLAVQAQADPGNRYAVPYLHAMNGIAYNIEMVQRRMPNAPLDSLAILFDPAVAAKFADCGITYLDSPEDVIQLALAYLHRDPNSERIDDLEAAEKLVMAVRSTIRTFDSNLYWQQLAAKEICIAMAWSSDFEVAQVRSKEDGTGAKLAFILPKEGSDITYNAFLIPAGAPHPDAALRFLNFILEPAVIAEISNDIHYGNDNLASRAYVHAELLNDPAVYPTPEVRARLYLPAAPSAAYERLRTRSWTRIKTGQ